MKSRCPRSRQARATAGLTALVLTLVGLTEAGTAVAHGSDTPAVHTTAAKKKPSLRVKINRPGHHAADVVVTGPGFSKHLTKTTTLRNLSSGVYHIRASKVRTGKWTASATLSTKKVKLSGKGANQEAVVDYGLITSNKLETLSSTKVVSYTAPGDSGTGTLVTHTRLEKGDFVASSISPAAPDGMLVKVVGVSKGQKGSKEYTVEQALLEDAIPRGSFDTTFTTDLAQPATASNTSGRPASPAPAASGLPITCSASGSAGVEVSAGGGVDVSFGADWDFGDSSITINAHPHASAQARAWMDAKGSCSTGEISLYTRKFNPIVVQLGVIPIVIIPSLEMFAGGSISASGAVEVQGSVGVDANVNGKASRKGFDTSFSGPTFSKSASLTTSATGTAEIHARAVVTGELYGLAGPHAAVKIGVEANLDKNANPWWTLDAVGSAGLGVKVDKCLKIFFKNVCVKFDASKEDMFTKRIRIADAGGPIGKEDSIVNDTAGPGVTVTGADMNTGSGGTGRLDLLGTGDAWVLSTGDITKVIGSDASVLADTDREQPGNPSLDALSANPTQDATFVTLNVRPSGNRLQVKYLFATEEFPEYVGSKYNDVVGIFVNGTNCALVPGTNTPVSVNTINPSTNSSYFVDNRDSHLPTVMNGLTTPLTCTVPVTPGQTYQVLVGVADASDGRLDSAVALLDGGISSFNG